MHAPNNQTFSCFWQPSLRLSWAVVLISLLACSAVFIAAIPWILKLGILLILCLHITRQLYLLQHRQQPQLSSGIRHSSARGWQLWSVKHGWQSVQLRADSIAIPALVLLRYRYAHQWFYRSVLIPADSLPQDHHRRLRVRLKFSRQRWQAIK